MSFLETFFSFTLKAPCSLSPNKKLSLGLMLVLEFKEPKIPHEDVKMASVTVTTKFFIIFYLVVNDRAKLHYEFEVIASNYDLRLIV